VPHNLRDPRQNRGTRVDKGRDGDDVPPVRREIEQKRFVARPSEGETLERGKNRERRPCDEDRDERATAGLLAARRERQQIWRPCERPGGEWIVGR
jgi:hypothetical protein